MCWFVDLEAEYREFVAEARLLLDIVAVEAADPAAVAAIRWQVARAIFAHRIREGRGDYELMLPTASPFTGLLAGVYRADYQAVTLGFATYLSDWPVARIAREWDAFRADTQALLGDVANRANPGDLCTRGDTPTERRAA
ncbi:hypothetical protein [Sphingomonas sp.]|uniref:hypothetical protein n=1 Tax=Sphingomonas sp. TaxID=28214 RepID=UPI001B1DEA69|nr:hypothetical protein [Sphingomonas sp.]MBO9713179.1 hypothetical protein [Sphingomonas sp.]